MGKGPRLSRVAQRYKHISGKHLLEKDPKREKDTKNVSTIALSRSQFDPELHSLVIVIQNESQK